MRILRMWPCAVKLFMTKFLVFGLITVFSTVACIWMFIGVEAMPLYRKQWLLSTKWCIKGRITCVVFRAPCFVHHTQFPIHSRLVINIVNLQCLHCLLNIYTHIGQNKYQYSHSDYGCHKGSITATQAQQQNLPSMAIKNIVRRIQLLPTEKNIADKFNSSWDKIV